MASSSTRGVHGVTLSDLHGEDIDLYDSKTKAAWNQQSEPNIRRVVLSTRPIRPDEFLYVKLSGTGSVRLGLTNSSPYDDNAIENFEGFILFEDYIYEKSVRKQFELKLNEPNHEAVYFPEFPSEQKTIQSRKIPKDLDTQKLFIFCEITFGNIRLSLETKESSSLISTSEKGDQILLENQNAMLTNITGGIIIPEIELQIDKPVHITLKPKQKISSGCFFMRYGLTNISPTNTTEEILERYCISSKKAGDDEQLNENDPFWFRTVEIRAAAFTGSFTLCLTKDFEVRSTIAPDCDISCLVPIGPDLKKPIWLVLEVFQADDVMVEVERAVIKESISIVEAIPTSHLVVVIWQDKEVSERAISDFVHLKAHEEPDIVSGTQKNRVLMKFKNERKVDYLRQILAEPSFWKLVDVIGIRETCAVLVSNLPQGESRRDIGLFFKNEQKVKMTLDVKKCEPRSSTGEAVLHLGSAEEGRCLCKKKLKYKQSVLKITPYYEILDDPSAVSEDMNNAEVPEFYDKTYSDVRKVQYLCNCQRSQIETLLATVCTAIKWRSKQGKEVRFHYSCQCGNTEECKRDWIEKSNIVFEQSLNRVSVEQRKVAISIWEQVSAVLDDANETIQVFKYEERLEIEIIGMRDELSGFLSTIDSIGEPPAPVSDKFEIRDTTKLQAIQEFQILSKIEKEDTVEVKLSRNGQVEIRGASENVQNAKQKILQEITMIQKKEYDLRHRYYKELLNLPMANDKIKAELGISNTKNGIIWKVSDEKLTVICKQSYDIENVSNTIMSAIKEQAFKFEGESGHHIDKLKIEISKITENFKTYARIDYRVNKKYVEITVTCIDGYLDTLHDRLKTVVEPLLSKEMKIPIPAYIAQYISDYMIDELLSRLERNGAILNESDIYYKDGSFHTKVNSEKYEVIRTVVFTLANQIHLEWKSHTISGIDQFFSEKEGVDFLRSLRGQCEIELLTKTEMKENNVHSVAALDSGAAIFVLAGDLSHPIERVDVIVNLTDAKLSNRKSQVSAAIGKKGGQAMNDECTAFIERRGFLKAGQIFISSAGELRCQKVFHCLNPTFREDTSDADSLIRSTMEDIIRTTNSDANGIFRSIALPLLGAGFGHEINVAAKITMEVLRDNVNAQSNIRQIFLYDRNPRVVRIIQSEMLRVFGSRCFKMQVENIPINKAKTLKPSKFHSVRRMGVRTIPLPGGKNLLLKWGELKNQKADVLVNAVATAPKLTNKNSKSLCDAARSPGFDLQDACEKEFKTKMQNGVVPDGTIVETTAGRLPSSAIFHIQIEYNWDGYSGKIKLQHYIQNCLLYAIKTDKRSIAFPTIGTADCAYPKNEVAQTFLRTVGEFIKKHSSSNLEEISIVIYKDDHESTVQFEETIFKIYSQRPHRLEAYIEEAFVLNKKGEEHEEKEEGAKDQEKKVPAVKLNNLDTRQPQPVVEWKYKISYKATLSLVVENIENVTADVIVCTTSAGRFPTLLGAIPNALMRVGGSSIQAECKQSYDKGLPQNDIPCTGAGKLKCQRLFYIPLEDYKSLSEAMKMKESVKQCLDKAERMKFNSICFPTIGTGNFKYPDTTSAKETFSAIQEYFAAAPQYLSKVVVALFRGAQTTNQVFQNQAAKIFSQISQKSPPIGGQDPQPQHQAGQSTESGFLVSIPNTSTTIEIYEGSLELSKVDVIVDTTTSFPNLNGAIPAALCRQGGSSIKADCQHYSGKADDGDIIETTAGNLQCKRLFHYVLPTWDSREGVQIIQNFMTKCLQMLRSKDFKSIALPSIGTGGYKYEPKKVAEGIYAAVQAHAQYHPGDVCKILIVLYAPTKIVNNEILDYFKHLPLPKGENQATPKRVTFADDANSELVPNDQASKDFVLLKLVSRDKKMIEMTEKKISGRIKDDSAPFSIPFPKHGEEVLKHRKNMKILEDLCASSNVGIEFDFKNETIQFKGISPKKNECKEKIRSLLNDMADKQGNLILGKNLLQNVEWCYLESDGTILVPYPKSIAYNLETEHSRGASDVKFKDTDGYEYTVDMKKMEEYRLVNQQKTSVIGIFRKDISTGELGHFPESWDPMDESSNVVIVPLDSTAQEYTFVLQEFQKTLGNFRLRNVVEISRIQNKSLYYQYRAEQKKLDALNQRKDNQRILWHGTAADRQNYITENGFNRNYAGDTFGNFTMYTGLGIQNLTASESGLENVASHMLAIYLRIPKCNASGARHDKMVMFPAPLLMMFVILNIFALPGCLVIWLISMLEKGQTFITGGRYHELWKAFPKFYRRHFELVSKYTTGFVTFETRPIGTELTGGNVWYGKGVYFAVRSEYTTDDQYSPRDQNGIKRVFMVKVLTGEYTAVYKGYNEKFAPLKPGSLTDRFDSTCDNAINPKEFIIFRDTSAYPDYIILFQ